LYVDQRHLTPDSVKSAETRGFWGQALSSGLPHLDPSRARSWIALVGLALFLALAAACSAPGEDSGSSESALAESGRWSLPADVKAAGKTVRVAYDDAPKWTGSAACGGKLLPGGHKLGEYLLGHFAVVTSVGGYACRRNTADSSRMSVHGTGRALDVFIPQVTGGADNGQGDKVANWLVTHAQQIGVQLVIWDRSIWRANGTNDAAYGGPNPHTDHIHVELSKEAAALTTPWFANMTDDTDTDASTSADAATRTDGSMPRVDAGTPDSATTDPTEPDAGDYEGDAATGDPADDDHIHDEPDADVTPDAGVTTADPPITGEPSDGLASAGDAPGETNSLPDVPVNNRKKGSATLDDPTPNAGCSTSPQAPTPVGTFGLTLGVGLALAAITRRKRR
jgi:hypothetical protein